MRERILLVVPFLAPGLTNPPVWAQVTPPRAVDAHFGRRPTSRRPGMRGLRYSLLSLLLAVSGWTSQIWNFFLNSPLDFLDYFMINLSCELRGSGARREGRTAGLSDFGISGWEWGQREPRTPGLRPGAVQGRGLQEGGRKLDDPQQTKPECIRKQAVYKNVIPITDLTTHAKEPRFGSIGRRRILCVASWLRRTFGALAGTSPILRCCGRATACTRVTLPLEPNRLLKINNLINRLSGNPIGC